MRDDAQDEKYAAEARVQRRRERRRIARVHTNAYLKTVSRSHTQDEMDPPANARACLPYIFGQEEA